MSRNFTLLLIVLALGTFTYYFQELGDREAYQQQLEEGVIVDQKVYGELLGVKLINSELKIDKGLYRMNDGEIADTRKVEKMMKVLAGIKVKRVLPDDSLASDQRKAFIPDETKRMDFLFEGGKVSYILGKKLDFDQTFYLEILKGEKEKTTKKLVIAFDDGEMETIYNKEDGHRSDHRYRRLESIFHLQNDFFRDYRLFREWMNGPWSLSSVDLDSQRNPPFKLDFKKGLTLPSKPSFLNYDLEMMKKWESDIAHLEGDGFADELVKGTALESEPYINVFVVSTKGEARLQLYRTQSTPHKYFLKSSLDGHYYQTKKEQVEPLFKHVQNFWDLKLIGPSLKELSVSFSGGDLIPVSFSRESSQFTAKSPNLSPSHKSFDLLLKFLQRKASYWSSGVGLFENSIEQFQLDFGKGRFVLMIRPDGVLLYHKESKQGLIYEVSDLEKLPLLKEEYFNE